MQMPMARLSTSHAPCENKNSMRKQMRVNKVNSVNVSSMEFVNSDGQTYFEYMRHLMGYNVYMSLGGFLKNKKEVLMPKYLLFWSDFSIDLINNNKRFRKEIR